MAPLVPLMVLMVLSESGFEQGMSPILMAGGYDAAKSRTGSPSIYEFASQWYGSLPRVLFMQSERKSFIAHHAFHQHLALSKRLFSAKTGTISLTFSSLSHCLACRLIIMPRNQSRPDCQPNGIDKPLVNQEFPLFVVMLLWVGLSTRLSARHGVLELSKTDDDVFVGRLEYSLNLL